MIDYRNILRLHSLEHSQREIERELSCSRHTISEVLVQAAATGISWPLDDSVTNEDIQEILFPGRYAFASPYTMPDFQYISQQLLEGTDHLPQRETYSRICDRNHVRAE